MQNLHRPEGKNSLLSPCDNFDYHMRNIDARTGWICQTFYYNAGTETHISSRYNAYMWMKPSNVGTRFLN